MTRLSTNVGSTMPLPIVDATAKWKKNTATTLKNAAQSTACQGLSTPVETTVAMEFAASWKPFMKSNANASAISRISERETVPRSMYETEAPGQAFSRTTLSITLATSWHLSVADS